MGDGAHQIFKRTAMADADAAHRDMLEHQRHHLAADLEAFEHADDRDVPADRHGFDGAPEIGGTHGPGYAGTAAVPAALSCRWNAPTGPTTFIFLDARLMLKER
ncbi:hypothetical protein SAMN05444161_1516 [Rhizobiales bacterium GAS191]|jgi:hypothetical protein|nr:hypothetical protein SAMN05444161_1516 [Rhizobiales bacterium GAS191]